MIIYLRATRRDIIRTIKLGYYNTLSKVCNSSVRLLNHIVVFNSKVRLLQYSLVFNSKVKLLQHIMIFKSKVV